MSIRSRLRVAFALMLLSSPLAADGLSGSVTPQLGGGIGGFNGGISTTAVIASPVVGCAGTGLNFTLACNSQYITAIGF